jgi:hypothetical protein
MPGSVRGSEAPVPRKVDRTEASGQRIGLFLRFTQPDVESAGHAQSVVTPACKCCSDAMLQAWKYHFS